MFDYNNSGQLVKRSFASGSRVDLSYLYSKPAGWFDEQLSYNRDLGSGLVHCFDYYRQVTCDTENRLSVSLSAPVNSPPPRWAKPAEKRVLRLANDCGRDYTLIGSKNDFSGSNDFAMRSTSCGDRLCPLCAALASKSDYQDLSDIAAALHRDYPDLQFVTVLLTCENFYPYYAVQGMDVFKTAVLLLRDSSKMSSKVSRLLEHNICDFEYTVNRKYGDSFASINFHAHLLCAVPKSVIFRHDRFSGEVSVSQKLLRDEFCRALRLACSKCAKKPHTIPLEYRSWLRFARAYVTPLIDKFDGLSAYAPERYIGKDSSGRDWVKVNIQRAYTYKPAPVDFSGEVFLGKSGERLYKDYNDISGAVSEVTKYMTKGYDDSKGLGGLLKAGKMPFSVNDAFVSYMVSLGYNRKQATRFGVVFVVYLCLQSMLFRRYMITTSGLFSDIAAPEDFQSSAAAPVDFWSDDLFSIRAVKRSFNDSGHEVVRTGDKNLSRTLLLTQWYSNFYRLSGGCTLPAFGNLPPDSDECLYIPVRSVFPDYDYSQYKLWLMWYQNTYCTDAPNGAVLTSSCAASRWTSYQKLRELATVLSFLQNDAVRVSRDSSYVPAPFKMERWLVRKFSAKYYVGYSTLYKADVSRARLPADSSAVSFSLADYMSFDIPDTVSVNEFHFDS